MTLLHGFELVDEREIAELSTHARLYRHARTGARLLSLENDDENKSFAVSFKTPPADDTGLPHILEHTVLSGSRKYPTKEPFVELLKTSVQTFLNAFTADDMTIYPVASANLQDFYNLVDVYLDAVFFPILTPEKLKQEGWHYENEVLDDDASPLIFKGVVFNEMKAAYSSPDRVLGYYAQKTLLPDTPYALEAGGIPAAIPDLTFEQFKTFHETYYHPSNAFITFYGDDDPTERLRIIDEALAEFDRREIEATLPRQPRFSAPVVETFSYDAGDVDASQNKSMMTVSWLLDEVKQSENILALNILEHILIGTPASPLRKTLIDSGLGEDVTGGGLDTWKREATFSVGLKNILADDAEKVESLIMDTLGKLADDGIDPATVEAAMNTVEFTLRERNTGMFPRGLATLLQFLPSWVHFENPLEAMAFEEKLNNIKANLQDNPQYFEGLIGKYLIDNPHRATVTIVPDPKVGPERDQQERERLDAYAGQLTDSDRQRIRDEAVTLKEMQETPDRPEDLAKIPVLSLGDLPRETPTIPREELDLTGGAKALYHDLSTSGIAYLNLAFELGGVAIDKLPYAQLLTRALLEMGTTEQDFVQLSQRIGARTGGIDASLTIGTRADNDNPYARFMVSAKAMSHQTDDLLALLKDILLTAELDNQARFKQIVLEEKASKEAYAAMAGHIYANSRVYASFSAAGHAQEQIGGLSYLMFLRELAERVDTDWAGVLSELTAVRDQIINRDGLLVSVTYDQEPWAQFRPALADFTGTLPANGATPAAVWSPADLPDYEGLSVPAQANFVGKAVNVAELGYEEHGSYIAIFKHMNLDYIWEKVRVQGGAYGGRAEYNPREGVVGFLSWRDPNLLKTLDVYNRAGDYLQKINLPADALEKAIIGAIGQIDKYMLPDMKGRVSLIRHIAGMTDAMRQQRRDELFATSNADFHRLGAVLSDIADKGKSVAVASPDALEKANSQGGKFKITRVL